MDEGRGSHQYLHDTVAELGQPSASTLLAFQSEVRAIRDTQELLLHLCNTSRRIFPYRQIFVLLRKGIAGKQAVVGASGVSIIDRNVPLIRWIEQLVVRLDNDVSVAEQSLFRLPAYCDENDAEVENYPFSSFMWTPLKEGEQVYGGVLFAREAPWQTADKSMAAEIAAIYGHALNAIRGQRRNKPLLGLRRIFAMALVLLVLLLSQCRVAVTAIAPVEVIPADPFVVTAPFKGVVKTLAIDRGAEVASGDLLVVFEDVHFRNDYAVAEQRVLLERTRYQHTSQTAIHSREAEKEIAVSKVAYELSLAEQRYARDLLAGSKLYAEQAGIAIYSDKRDWVGRPVSAGETIMQVADPKNLQFQIRLPVDDSLVLKKGARVKLFLDSNPLRSYEAHLVEAAYQAVEDKYKVLSFQLIAEFNENVAMSDLPRIGVQGSAQLYGEKHSLFYVLLRKPFSTLRQTLGW